MGSCALELGQEAPSILVICVLLITDVLEIFVAVPVVKSMEYKCPSVLPNAQKFPVLSINTAPKLVLPWMPPPLIGPATVVMDPDVGSYFTTRYGCIALPPALVMVYNMPSSGFMVQSANFLLLEPFDPVGEITVPFGDRLSSG